MDGKDWFALIVSAVAAYYVVTHFGMTGRPA